MSDISAVAVGKVRRVAASMRVDGEPGSIKGEVMDENSLDIVDGVHGLFEWTRRREKLRKLLGERTLSSTGESTVEVDEILLDLAEVEGGVIGLVPARLTKELLRVLLPPVDEDSEDDAPLLEL
jgi:hypothetical protein